MLLDASERPADPSGGDGRRVLLVDDDPDVLRVTGASLRRVGFAVVAVSSGDAALAALAAGGAFAALVTDYAMPGLSGLALVEQAATLAPAMPALMVTGYGHETDLSRLPARVQVLAKPFTRQQFCASLAALIGAPGLAPPDER